MAIDSWHSAPSGKIFVVMAIILFQGNGTMSRHLPLLRRVAEEGNPPGRHAHLPAQPRNPPLIANPGPRALVGAPVLVRSARRRGSPPRARPSSITRRGTGQVEAAGEAARACRVRPSKAGARPRFPDRQGDGLASRIDARPARTTCPISSSRPRAIFAAISRRRYERSSHRCGLQAR